MSEVPHGEIHPLLIAVTGDAPLLALFSSIFVDIRYSFDLDTYYERQLGELVRKHRPDAVSTLHRFKKGTILCDFLEGSLNGAENVAFCPV